MSRCAIHLNSLVNSGAEGRPVGTSNHGNGHDFRTLRRDPLESVSPYPPKQPKKKAASMVLGKTLREIVLPKCNMSKFGHHARRKLLSIASTGSTHLRDCKALRIKPQS